MDVADEQSIENAKIKLEEQFGGLKILIDNAADVAHCGGRLRMQTWRPPGHCFDTTLFGRWAVTKAFLPLPLKSRPTRIVCVSSGAGLHNEQILGLQSTNAMGPSYALAKTALNAFTSLLAKDLEKAGVSVNAVYSGLTATFPGAAAIGAGPVPERAAGIVWAALLPDDGPTGGFFRDGNPRPW